MFWNRRNALRQRAEQAEAERDQLRQQLNECQQQLASTKALYEIEQNTVAEILAMVDARMTFYKNIVERPSN